MLEFLSLFAGNIPTPARGVLQGRMRMELLAEHPPNDPGVDTGGDTRVVRDRVAHGETARSGRVLLGDRSWIHTHMILILIPVFFYPSTRVCIIPSIL